MRCVMRIFPISAAPSTASWRRVTTCLTPWPCAAPSPPGFHAPTPGQSNARKVTTTFDANLNVSVEEGTLPPGHPLVQAAGGAPLKEEQSVNLSLGFAADLTDMLGGADTTLTVDFYRIKIDDRIYKTSGKFPVPHPDSITTDCNDIRMRSVRIFLSLPTRWIWNPRVWTWS